MNFGSLKKRHGTILPVTETEYNAILKAFDKNKDTEPVTPDEDGSGPIAEYDFEDSKGTDTTENSNDLTFNGNAKVSEDAEKGKVLKLDGSDATRPALSRRSEDPGIHRRHRRLRGRKHRAP